MPPLYESILKSKVKFSFFSRYYITIFFLIISFFLIYLPFNGNYILFFLLIILALFPFINHAKDHLQNLSFSFFLSIFFSIILYLLLYKYVNATELWGDEIGVISIAYQPFQDIASLAFSKHAAAPPLDYWALHFWKILVDLFPVSTQEFLFRIPYMIYHILGSLIFLHLTSRFFYISKNILYKNFVNFILFSIFFLNPLLLQYSLEVRFYSLSILGSLLNIYFYETKQIYSNKYLPVQLLFCLNSVFHFIVLFPFLLLAKNEKNSSQGKIFTLIAFSSMLSIIFPKLNTFSVFHVGENLPSIMYSLQEIFFIHFTHIASILIILLIIFSLKKEGLKALTYGLVFLFEIFTISLLSYWKSYPYFNIRHLLFAVPTLLLFLILLIKTKNKFFTIVNLLLFGFIFIIPFVKNDLLIKKITFDDSYPYGMKLVQSMAQSNSISKIIVQRYPLNSESTLPVRDQIIMERINRSMYDDFYLRNMLWYLKRYNIDAVTVTSSSEACQFFSETENSAVLLLYSKIPCSPQSTVIQTSDNTMLEFQN